MVGDENQSPYLQDNINSYLPADWVADADFKESNKMHNINGYAFCGAPNNAEYIVTTGKRSRWYLAALGEDFDVHTPHWHGNVVATSSIFRDEVELVASTTVVVDMIPDDLGTWLYHCHVNDHIDAGMIATYTVTGPFVPFPSTGKERNYYLRAEAVEWDYAHTGMNQCTDPPSAYTLNEAINTLPLSGLDNPDGFQRIGTKYVKVRYLQYTDATFTTRIPSDPRVGIMGPVLRAEVGDTIVVTFSNAIDFPITAHPHGVRYVKDGSEGWLIACCVSQQFTDMLINNKGRHTMMESIQRCKWGTPSSRVKPLYSTGSYRHARGRLQIRAHQSCGCTTRTTTKLATHLRVWPA